MFGHYYSNSQPIPKSPSNALVSRVSCSLLSIFLKMFLSVAFANSCNDILFLAGNQLYELQSNRRGWWGQKKTIATFGYKQRLLSLDMKTKIVQHVPTINISIWHITCDMWHATCYIITNTHFWAFTWKEKLFRTFKH